MLLRCVRRKYKVVCIIPFSPYAHLLHGSLGTGVILLPVAAEGEGQVIVVQGNVLCQRHGQVEPQSQIAVTLGEAVDLLFGFAAALGKQNLGILNGGGVQGGKSVEGIGVAQDLYYIPCEDMSNDNPRDPSKSCCSCNIRTLGRSHRP